MTSLRHPLPPVPAQLRILQAVSGYAADEDEAGAAGSTAGAAAAAAGGRGALEAALVAKSRQLEHKLTTLRLELAEARGAPRLPGWAGARLLACWARRPLRLRPSQPHQLALQRWPLSLHLSLLHPPAPCRRGGGGGWAGRRAGGRGGAAEAAGGLGVLDCGV